MLINLIIYAFPYWFGCLIKHYYLFPFVIIPIVLLSQTVLVLGTKLEVIVAKMALKLHDQNGVVIGTPLVKPNDDLFWFGHPKFVLTLLHLTLFTVINYFSLISKQVTIVLLHIMLYVIQLNWFPWFLARMLLSLASLFGSRYWRILYIL